MLYILVSIVLLDDTIKFGSIQERNQLSEDVFVFVHSGILYLAAKIQIQIRSHKFRYIII